MKTFTKLDQIRKHLGLEPTAATPLIVTRPAAVAVSDGGIRVQKNLSILQQDAERLAALAKRDGLSQARLLSAALDAYEKIETELKI